MTAASMHAWIAVILGVLATGALSRGLWLMLRPTHGRHEQREQEELLDLCTGCFDDSEHCDGAIGSCCCTCGFDEDWAEQDIPPERSREELGFTGELQALPAPGLDYISDPGVRLPWTPPAYGIAAADKTYPLTESELDEVKARFLAAVERGDPPKVLPPEPVTHYASSIEGLVGDIQPRIACGTAHWAVVSEDRAQVTCEDCLACEQLASGALIEVDSFDPRNWGLLGPVAGHLPGCGCGLHAERLATDTDVRTSAGELPAWVVEALGGHDGVDACVESIVARTVTDA